MNSATMKTPSALLPDAGSLKGYIVINGWRSEHSPVVPASSLGTESFTVAKAPWSIVWSLRGRELVVTVYGCGAQDAPYVREVVHALHSGQGIAYIEHQGAFYLNIESRGDWIVKAVSVEEVGAIA